MIQKVEIWSDWTRNKEPELLETLELDTAAYALEFVSADIKKSGYYVSRQRYNPRIRRHRMLSDEMFEKFLSDNGLFYRYKDVEYQEYIRDGIVTYLPCKLRIIVEEEDNRSLPDSQKAQSSTSSYAGSLMVKMFFNHLQNQFYSNNGDDVR